MRLSSMKASLAAGPLRLRLLCTAVLSVVIVLAWAGWSYVRLQLQDTPAPVILGAVGNTDSARDLGIVAGEPPVREGLEWSTIAPVLDPIFQEPTATAFGPVVVVETEGRAAATSSPTPVRGEDAPDTALVSLNPDDGSVRWFRELSPAAEHYIHQPRQWRDRSWNRSFSATYLSSSPDGDRIAVRLLPSTNGRQTIAVLSADTGETVRQVEVEGNILGQALTDEALVVETSPTAFPQGGTVTSYPLEDDAAGESSWEAYGWLAGATAEGVIVSPVEQPALPHGERLLAASITIADPVSGETLNTVSDVYHLHPHGWAERYVDPAGESLARSEPEWNDSPRELVDLSTGARVDITGLTADAVTTPTGGAWALYSSTWEESEDAPSRQLALASWFPCEPGAGDGPQPQLRSDPLRMVIDSGDTPRSGSTDFVAVETHDLGEPRPN